MTFVVHAEGEAAAAFIPTFGTHNVVNALAAIAVGIRAGLQLAQSVEALRELTATAGRLNIIENGSIRIIDDCYNASPASTKASLDVLAHLASSNRIAILGDMFELGSESEAGHREVGAFVAKLGIEGLIAVGEMSQWIADAARSAGMSAVRHIATVEAAIDEAANLVPVGATVLVKASRGMQLERIVERLRQIH